MTIHTENYKPFGCLRRLHEYGQSLPSKTCKETALKVSFVVLSLLITPPVFVIDFVLTSAALAKRCCLQTQSQRGCSLQSRLPPDLFQSGQLANPFESQLLKNPYPYSAPYDYHFKFDQARFMQDTMKWAVALHDEASQKLYKEMLENHGCLIDEDYPPIEIFSWAAGCTILRALVYRNYNFYMAEESFPILALKEQGAMELLLKLYGDLSAADKPGAFMQIIAPESQWQLESNAAKDFVDAVNAAKHELTRSKIFKETYLKAYPII